MKVQPEIIVELVHIHGPLKGNIQEFADDSISIGRHPSSSIQFPLELTSVSRKHAEILREGNRFKLLDHSTNGTFLNGRKVTEAYLKDGDVLEFSEGGPKLSFLSRVAEQAPAPVSTRQTPSGSSSFAEPSPLSYIQQKQSQPMVPPSDSTPPAEPVSAPESAGAETPQALPVEKVSAPLVIQFGPSIRSYKELPIVIGSGPGCDFVIQNSTLKAQHAQILFAHGEYWIRDLTGERMLRINNNPIDLQSPIHINDLIMLSPQCPLLSFLGEGRFAEASETSDSAAGPSTKKMDEVVSPHGRQDEDSDGLWARLRRRF